MLCPLNLDVGGRRLSLVKYELRAQGLTQPFVFPYMKERSCSLAENPRLMEQAELGLNAESTQPEELLTLSEFCAATGRSAWGILMDIKSGKIARAASDSTSSEGTMIPASELKKARARRSSQLSQPSPKATRAEGRAEDSFESAFRDSFDSTLLDSVETPTSFELYVPGESKSLFDSSERARLEKQIDALQSQIDRLELELDEQKTAVLSQTQSLSVTQAELYKAEAVAAQERDGRLIAEGRETKERDGRLSAETQLMSLTVALEDAERRASAPWWKHLLGLTKRPAQ